MNDGPPTPPARPAARRRALPQTVLTVAASATAVAALVWSALLYDATRKQSTAISPSRAQTAPARGASQQTPAVAPVTTRTS